MDYDFSLTLANNVLRLLPPGTGLDGFIPHAQRQIFLLLVLASLNGFYLPGITWVTVPVEIWYRIIFSLVSTIPNRGLCPFKLIHRLKKSQDPADFNPWSKTAIYGSSMINRFSTGNWYPEDWDFAFPGKFHVGVYRILAEFLGYTQGDVKFINRASRNDSGIRIIQIGPYRIDLAGHYRGGESIDLTHSGRCFMYDFSTRRFFYNDWTQFPENHSRPPEFSFKYVDPDVLWNLSSRGLTLAQLLESRNVGDTFIDEGIEQFLEKQEQRFLKYQERFKKDGVLLKKEMVECPARIEHMFNSMKWYFGFE